MVAITWAHATRMARRKPKKLDRPPWSEDEFDAYEDFLGEVRWLAWCGDLQAEEVRSHRRFSYYRFGDFIAAYTIDGTYRGDAVIEAELRKMHSHG